MTREQLRQLLQQALAEVVRERLFKKRLRQKHVACEAGISDSHLRALLRAEKGCTMFVFLELSRGLLVEPCELLGEILRRRESLRSPR